MKHSLPAFDDVRRALERIKTDIHTTPVLHSSGFDRETGCTAFFKAENFQRTGAFKLRGAINKIRSLQDSEKTRGVVTFSSGNHGQATALAARLEGIRCIVVMPQNASEFKKKAASGYGAILEFAGTTSEERMTRALELQNEYGSILVPPYDDPFIIAGQGTCAVEIVNQIPDLDIVLIPVGGGGLISGCAIVIKSLNPKIKVIGVETEGADDANRSFREKKLIRYDRTETIADGMRNLCVGDLNFEAIVTYVDDMLTVTDDGVRDMMKFFFERMKIAVEPTGAVSAAAIRTHSGIFSGKRVCAIISGGNIGTADFCMHVPSVPET